MLAEDLVGRWCDFGLVGKLLDFLIPLGLDELMLGAAQIEVAVVDGELGTLDRPFLLDDRLSAFNCIHAITAIIKYHPHIQRMLRLASRILRTRSSRLSSLPLFGLSSSSFSSSLMSSNGFSLWGSL